MRRFVGVFLILLYMSLPLSAQIFPSAKRRPDPGPMPKNIHGIVSDVKGKPIVGAKVFVKDLKSNVIRTLETDQEGIFKIFALTPTVDYEVHAEYKGKASDKRTISQFMNRQDNVLNFQFDVVSDGTGGGGNGTRASEFMTFDNVKLHATVELPSGVPAPIPAVLLLHGFGEDRNVWQAFTKQLIAHGYAVIALDLRGHGESTTKDNLPLQPTSAWRMDPHELPQDLDPTLDFIKTQTRLNNRKIIVIGSDVGADLALIASGKFPEVRTVVAMNPKYSESLALAGSAQDFTPHSALLFSTDASELEKLKPLVKQPSDFQTRTITGGTAAWTANAAVTDAILAWLQKTF